MSAELMLKVCGIKETDKEPYRMRYVSIFILPNSTEDELYNNLLVGLEVIERNAINFIHDTKEALDCIHNNKPIPIELVKLFDLDKEKE